MGKKKAVTRAAPNVSSASSLSVAAATQKSNSSSILRSAFSPSRFQLSLFASVIQNLDSQQLRIHDTTTGCLRCEHTASRSEITALDWGYYGAAYRIPDEQPSKKRRRKLEETNGAGDTPRDIVVAFGTDQSQIHIFSPSEAKVLATLSDGHTRGIRDFKFTNFGINAEAWSLGGDGKLVQWNLHDGTISRSIASPTPSASALLPLEASLLVASNSTHILDTSNAGKSIKLGEGSTSTQYLATNKITKADTLTSYLAAFDNDRFINVYDISSGDMTGSLVAEADVTFISQYTGSENVPVLGAVTTKGEVELFQEPFAFESRTSAKQADLKSKRKQMTKRAAAKIHISREGQGASMPIVALSFQEGDLVLAYVENGASLAFDHMPWMDEQNTGLTLHGNLDIKRAGTLVGIENATMNGVKQMGKLHVDESRAVVSKGADTEPTAMDVDKPEVIDISSGEEDSDVSSKDEEPISVEKPQAVPTNGVDEDAKMEDAEFVGGASGEGDEQDEEEEGVELSFGERLRANAPDTVDVAASFPSKNQEVVPHSKGISKPPPGISLGAVLTQSLRSNDLNLLESCLHTQDLHIVRATIERLDSSLATILLKKLAERLHSRPGRAGSLLVWVQWTLISHGGYLGSQPDVVKQLASLLRVVKERASSLQPLLSLKGKLDMLEAQMNLRKSMQNRYGITEGAGTDEEKVIYVEGQEDSSSEASSSDNEAQSDDEVDQDVEDLDDDAESDERSENDLIDDEASETDADSEQGLDDDDIDHDDVDSFDEDSEDEGPAAGAKSKGKLTNGISSKKE